MFWTELICLSLLAICMDSFWWKLELSWFVITWTFIALRLVTGLRMFTILAQIGVAIMSVTFIAYLYFKITKSK